MKNLKINVRINIRKSKTRIIDDADKMHKMKLVEQIWNKQQNKCLGGIINSGGNLVDEINGRI